MIGMKLETGPLAIITVKEYCQNLFLQRMRTQLTQEGNTENQPELDVVQRLPDLLHLEMPVTDARIVLFHARNSNVSLTVAKTFRADWIRWHEEQNDESPKNGNRSCNDIHVLPAVQASSSDVTKTIIDQRRDSTDVSSCTIPGAHSKRLLSFLVPAANDKHKHWRYSGFEKAEEEALRVEALPIGARGGAHETGAPDSNNSECHTLDWPSLSHQNGWVAPNNKTEIEDCS